ncbi:MAG: type II toxin-antitoxin system VapC family toxin [Caldimonas sp.]
MIGLDTNVLVRYVMQDDARQSPKATLLMESLSGESAAFVPQVVVIEFVWVLSSSYALSRPQVASALDGLLRSKELVVERADQVMKALRMFNAGTADFADCLIERVAQHAGCTATMTFDAGAAKTAGMTLIQ